MTKYTPSDDTMKAAWMAQAHVVAFGLRPKEEIEAEFERWLDAYKAEILSQNENLKVDSDYIEYGISTPFGYVPRGSWSPDYWTVHAQLALLDPETNYKIVSRKTKILVSEWEEPTELLSAEEQFNNARK